jgi:hypothetical protein
MTDGEAAEWAAHRAITDVIHRYCRSMDRIDAELGYSVWHEDGVADYGPLFQGSGREFIDWVCDYHRGIESHLHQVGNITIDLAGDHAGSETYITVALLHRQDGAQMLTTGRGRYLDRWSRRAGRWAIDRRHYVLDFAITESVTAQMGWGARDKTDPSYQIINAV